MAVEKLFHLARIDVLAAPDDHVLDPPDDVDVAVLIHGGQVAGMHPARPVDSLAGGFFVVPVAAHHHVSAAAQLARGTSLDDGAGARIDDLDLDMRMDAAHRGD